MAPIPPTQDANRLRLELRLTPHLRREDAVQEAWLAHLEGRNPARAVNTFARRERRLAVRNQTNSRRLQAERRIRGRLIGSSEPLD